MDIVYIKTKNQSIIELVLTIILSLYAALDPMWVVLIILLKIVYSSYTNLDDTARLSYNIIMSQ